MQTLSYKTIESPVGLLKLFVGDGALRAILWENENLTRVPFANASEDRHHPLLIETERQLHEYFNQQRLSFDLPLKPCGTPFQQSVWQWLSHIPYGTTWSYMEVAKRMNHPQAVRAVGGAIGKNPISIIIPCHRVIGANGSLTGFAGGLPRKKILLNLEKVLGGIHFPDEQVFSAFNR